MRDPICRVGVSDGILADLPVAGGPVRAPESQELSQ